MGLYRVRGDENGREGVKYEAVPLEAWLADLQNERDCIISRLRHIDRVLIEHGKIKGETIPRRIK